MTKNSVLAQLFYARVAYAAGNCDKALGHMQLAWDDLQAFSQALAAARRSPSPAVKLHRQVARVYSMVRQRCTGEALMPPTFRQRSGGADLIAPTFATRVGPHPDLIAPSFQGVLVEGDAGKKPWVGLAVMVAVVAGGFWMASR